ncbi:MAG: alpha/beta fold hydrolase [Kordiimonadaceae bacterium]|nr:alpha/beta fold hydrolase [Kordiimonadaceae bacterium]MBO6567123.1 alpha/beta fold hydrolase [Kordiimonadaceae bacterium]MBO6963662.1 alpha/beta fold hydrolase [Kordiimonadaceae bacterium]
MADFYNPEYVDNDGVKLAVYRDGPLPSETDKPAVIFMHGWPDVAITWNHQLAALGAAGYPVFTYDGRGYGRSDAPEGRENYTMAKLTSDIVAVQDHFGIDAAVLVGHDWGAIVLWQTPFYIGDRVLGCAGLNVPLLRHYPVDPVTIFRQALGENMYIVRFQEEGACEPILEKDFNETFKFFMRKPSGGKAIKKPKTENLAFAFKSIDLISILEAGEDAWGGTALLGQEEMDYYVDAFSRNGMTGPLHWYRNMPANWEAQKQFLVDGALPKVMKPCLMFTAELDGVCPPRLADGMEELCEPYERVDFKGIGHWTQQEKATEVNEKLIDWIGRHFE